MRTALTLFLLLASGALADSWYPGDLHTHSVYSWDAAALGGDDVARCIRLGEKQGLEFLSIQDHQVVSAQSDPAFTSQKLTPVPALEWGIMGHAGIHGTRTVVPEVDTQRPASTWNQQVELALTGARARGSAVVVNHPTHPEILWAWTTEAFDAVEVWNAGWMFPFPRATTRPQADALLKRRGLGDVPGALSAEAADALEEQSGGFNAQGVRFWEAHLERGAKAGAVGGGDRHVLIAPGYPTTWIRATDRALPTLLESLREGRTAVTRSPRVRPPELTARTAGSGAAIEPGGSVPVGQPVALTLFAPLSGRGRAVIYRDRTALATVELSAANPTVTLTDTPYGPTWYRADVFEPLVDMHFTAAQAAVLKRIGEAGAHAAPQDMLEFFNVFGEPIADPARLPSFALPDPFVRFINADPKQPGWCRSGMTSPIYAR